jgi:hypothetical protein
MYQLSIFSVAANDINRANKYISETGADPGIQIKRGRNTI